MWSDVRQWNSFSRRKALFENVTSFLSYIITFLFFLHNLSWQVFSNNQYSKCMKIHTYMHKHIWILYSEWDAILSVTLLAHIIDGVDEGKFLYMCNNFIITFLIKLVIIIDLILIPPWYKHHARLFAIFIKSKMIMRKLIIF